MHVNCHAHNPAVCARCLMTIINAPPCCAHDTQMLNDIKARLNSLVAHGQQLRRQMAEREAELGSFQTDFSSTEKQAKAEQRTFRRQQGQQHDM